MVIDISHLYHNWSNSDVSVLSSNEEGLIGICQAKFIEEGVGVCTEQGIQSLVHRNPSTTDSDLGSANEKMTVEVFQRKHIEVEKNIV